jgi:tetratricopeptide (TPR) repeat protein
MLASTIWLETLNKSRLLQASIYSTQSFYTKTEEKPDPQVSREFRDLARQATQLAKARLQRNPRDAQAIYQMGAIESMKASYDATVERHFFAALREGSSGVDRHREVIKLDPNFHDAELTIGVYDYIVGTLPFAAKMLASITGARGSKKRGIETLERVAKLGRWEQDDARVLLIAFYKREKRFPESLAASRELEKKYPRNYLFKLESADTLILQAVAERQAKRIKEAEALEAEAFTAFDTLLRERATATAPVRALDLIHFRYGEVLLVLSQPERAAQEFLNATTANGAEAGLVTRSHLRAAQAFDLAGKRNEALAEYRIVLGRPNIYDSLEQARRGVKEPYKAPK